MKTNTTGSNVTSITAVKKIDRAREIFARVSDTKYVAPEGSSPRAEFIKSCIADLSMTDSGASTYWQNLSTEAKGGPLYKHAKAPTGAPRGRKPDGNRELKRAAARVQALTDRATKANTELADATKHFTELTAQAAQ